MPHTPDTSYTPEQVAALIAALQVLVLDDRTRRYLKAYDVTALEQARHALRQVGAPATEAEMRRANAEAWRATVARQQAEAADLQARLDQACATLAPSPLESSPDAAGEWDVDARMAEAAEQAEAPFVRCSDVETFERPYSLATRRCRLAAGHVGDHVYGSWVTA